jgi:large subunit ribosomal protein L3
MMTILGIKKEMTQLFDENGKAMAVTIVDVSNNSVVGLRNEETDGYSAAIIGMGKKRAANKAEEGQYKKLGYVPQYIVEDRNMEVKEEDKNKDVDFSGVVNKKVTVTGISKGKGFQGVVKRWGFAGGPKTHGQSDRHRAPGSIGSGTTPGRVYKGKKMAGRMGGDRKTIKNLKIVKYIESENLIVISGPVPGSKNSLLVMKVKE